MFRCNESDFGLLFTFVYFFYFCRPGWKTFYLGKNQATNINFAGIHKYSSHKFKRKKRRIRIVNLLFALTYFKKKSKSFGKYIKTNIQIICFVLLIKIFSNGISIIKMFYLQHNLGITLI